MAKLRLAVQEAMDERESIATVSSKTMAISQVKQTKKSNDNFWDPFNSSTL